LPRIIGLDTCKKSKPAREVLELAASQTGASFEECLSVGDRYDIDLALPLELGMGAVLVDGAEDVKKLPSLIEYANL
ncbi:MAG: HAD hydrolase-like protein, partial [Treponema sp.]|nr:HAD hydrolase-like protein [Treponema sp.]